MTSSGSATVNTKYRITTDTTGFLFGKIGCIVLLVFMLLAVWFDLIAVAFILGLLLATAGISRLWSWLSLRNVTYQRTLKQTRLFPGETTELVIRLDNRKLVPLPWIQTTDELPLSFESDIPLQVSEISGRGVLKKTASLLWYTRISWRYPLSCDKRGYYKLGSASLSSGDIFGLYPRHMELPEPEHIIVYPRIYPVEKLGIPSLYPLGETRSECRIFQDPIRVSGIRDYTPQDSLRYVHWKASARHNQLQVKLFEPTTTLRVALFLGVDTFRHESPEDEELFELAISAAASIANHTFELRSSVGLYVNALMADGSLSARIPISGSSTQLTAILESLAKVTATADRDCSVLLEEERAGLPWGSTIVIIVSSVSEPLANLLASLKGTGHKLLVLQVGQSNEILTRYAIPNHLVGSSADIAVVAGESQ